MATSFGTYSDSGLSTNDGGIFELTTGSSTITLLAACNEASTGKYPGDSLVLGKNGMLYGASLSGGANDLGAVFSFAAPVPPAKLLIQQQPAATVTNGVVSMKVAVLDAKGKVITNGTFSVTLALQKGPGATVADVIPVTVTTVNGIATFSDIALPAVVGTYTFQITEGVLKPVTSRGAVIKKAVVKPAHAIDLPAFVRFHRHAEATKLRRLLIVLLPRR